MRTPNSKRIILLGDEGGELKKAVEELQQRDGIAEGVSLVGVSLSKLGMGSQEELPDSNEKDFLDGIKPWEGPSTVQ